MMIIKVLNYWIVASLTAFISYLLPSSSYSSIGICRRMSSQYLTSSSLRSSYTNDLVRPPIEFNLAQVLETAKFLEDHDDLAKIMGVYAVQSKDGEIKYVGTSLTIASSVKRHVEKFGIEELPSIRIQTFSNPSTDALNAYKLELIRQTSPSGNLVDAASWDDSDVVLTNKSETVSTKENELEAVRGRLSLEINKDKSGDIQSPFEGIIEEGSQSESVGESFIIGPKAGSGLEFTKENVDKVLDEVRPYLISDGGNVAVVSVDDFTRSVSLVLQGACGSCPSSTVNLH